MSGPMTRLTHNENRQPRSLAEAQEVSTSIELNEQKDFQTMFDLFDKNAYFYVYDSTDRHFKLPCRAYCRVKSDLKNKLEEPGSAKK